MKYNNYAIFFDGTWNKHSSETNVWLLREGLRLGNYQFEGEDCEFSTDAFYVSGPGTSADMKVFGGGFAMDLADAIVDAYAWICEKIINLKHQEPETIPQIYLFGFSRGAYRAHMFSWMLNDLGIVLDFAKVRNAAELWCNHKRERVDELLASTSVIQSPRIKFMGLWDVVSAPLDVYKHYNDGKKSPLVEKLSHAMAANEHRLNFPVMKYNSADSSVEQVWFPGAHSDVGGGYPRDERALSNNVLQWMKLRAYKEGLDFKVAPVQEAQQIKLDSNVVLHDEALAIRKLFKRYNREFVDGESFHPLIRSLAAQGGYQPYLIACPALDRGDVISSATNIV